MDRNQLLIAALVIGIGWYLYKKYVRKDSRSNRTDFVGNPEQWYSRAQEKIEQMDPQLRGEKEVVWQALSDEEKLDKSEVFLHNAFSAQILQSYDTETKLKLGKAYFLTKTDEKPTGN